MRWKQLFLPVQSIDPEQAEKMIDQYGAGELEILDVRQTWEYEKGHIPGAKLVPLPELENRLSELDPGKPHLVY
jgi:rhodanese-related sulfurtransferase